MGIGEECTCRGSLRFAKTNRRFALGFRAENNLKQRTAAIRRRMVDLRHGIINCTDGIIEGILDDEIGRDEPAVIQFYNFQRVRIEGQVHFKSNEICDVLNCDRRPRRMI